MTRLLKGLIIVLLVFSLLVSIGAAYPIMHPDTETLKQLIDDYNNAPAIEAPDGFRMMSAPTGVVNLLPHIDYVPADRNQVNCGNCWEWAGTGVIEIAHDVAFGVHDRLSVQYINSEYRTPTWGYGCCGGWLQNVRDFYSAEGFVIPWSNTQADWVDWQTSCASGASLRPVNTITTTPQYGITTMDIQRIPTQDVSQADAIANIKSVLDGNRGVYFGFFLPDAAAWDTFYDFWDTDGETGIFPAADFVCGTNYNSAPNQGGGHAIVIVGYDDTTDPANPYWLALNSWGTANCAGCTARPNGLVRIDMNLDYGCSLPGLNAEGSSHSLFFQTLDIAFDNHAPVADANGPYTGSEGTAIEFDASGSSDADGNPLQYRWDINDDGIFEIPWTTDAMVTHTWCDDYTGNVILEVTDGQLTATDISSVTVTNVAPVADAEPDTQTVDEGGEAWFDAGASYDPGCDTLSYHWDFGDRVHFADVQATTLSYCDDGVYTVTLTVSDGDGGEDTDTVTVTVNNVPPVADAGPDQTVYEGDTVQFTGSATDAGTCDTLSYAWDFGDSSAPVTGTLTPVHEYCDDGVYTVTLTVSDGDGGESTDTVTVTVDNVAPTVTKGAMDQPNPEFILPVHTLTFHATFSDPGWCDTHTAMWDFGDGQTSVGTLTEENIAPDATGTVTTTHAFSAPGDYSVTVTVTDDDGGATTSAAWIIHIADVAEAKHILAAYIQGLPANAFKGKETLRKAAFANKFVALDDMIANEDWNGFITSLQSDIRTKADGQVDGKPGDDWIRSLTAQQHICMKIDDIVAYVETFL